MQPDHLHPLYERNPDQPEDFAKKLAKLAALHGHSATVSSAVFHKTGRNRLTRVIDSVLEFVRRYLPPLHWVATRSLVVLLYSYTRVVGATAEFVTAGSYRWPDIPRGAVLAIWHGSAPSLLAAVNARRPDTPVKLMVSRDARGDCVAIFCRWLGFEIVRGDAEHGGWKALNLIAQELHHGAVAVISPDGGGPALIARVGAVVLAAAAGVPLIPIGTDCRPSILERHKWDQPRNPVPYGRIALVCGEPLTFHSLHDAAGLESGRQQLQDALDRAAKEARMALDSQPRKS